MNSMSQRTANLLRFLLLAIAGCFYILYLAYIIVKNQGPVDYETFMRIGQHFLDGKEVYGVNSYYPLPYVMVFSLFSMLPRPVSMALWLVLPVLAALWIGGWQPWVLLFAPLYGHFIGGQTSIFGLLGLWGYRKNLEQDRYHAGIWLALLFLKPQLAIIPFLWAVCKWWREVRNHHRLPKEMMGWMASMAVIFLPSFLFIPDWPLRWLSNPRPLAERAIAGLLPRLLLWVLSPKSWQFVTALVSAAVVLAWILYRANKNKVSFDTGVFWYYIVSPIIHDYDTIQLIPLIEDRAERWIAVALSIPLWLVMLFAYQNDAAWIAVTIIAPGILLYRNLKINHRQESLPVSN